MFKQCSKCKREWENRDDFLEDSGISLIGYQVHFEETNLGFFLFNHSCGTSLAVKVDVFADLYRGPIYKKKNTGSATCPGYCLNMDNLEPCPEECECAFVRDIMQIIRRKNTKGTDDSVSVR